MPRTAGAPVGYRFGILAIAGSTPLQDHEPSRFPLPWDGLALRAGSVLPSQRKDIRAYAGKNACMGGGTCQKSGAQCFCLARADAGHIGEPFCGEKGVLAANCSECTGGPVCTIGCDGGLVCNPPCPDPL